MRFPRHTNLKINTLHAFWGINCKKGTCKRPFISTYTLIFNETEPFPRPVVNDFLIFAFL